MGDHARQLIETYGYTALKIGPSAPNGDADPWAVQLDTAERRMAAVRSAVGDAIDIGVDPHAKILEPARALEMAERIRPYRPFFFEEPVRPEQSNAGQAGSQVADSHRQPGSAFTRSTSSSSCSPPARRTSFSLTSA